MSISLLHFSTQDDFLELQLLDPGSQSLVFIVESSLAHGGDEGSGLAWQEEVLMSPVRHCGKKM